MKPARDSGANLHPEAEGLGVAPYELIAPQGNRDQAALESFARDLERGFSDLVKKGLRAN